MIAQITDEFRVAGWIVHQHTIPKVWVVKPSPNSYKQYFLMPFGSDWVMSSKLQLGDPEYDEALCILNRARVKMASDTANATLGDRTFCQNAIAPQEVTQYPTNHMPHFIRISDDSYINLDDVREVYVNRDREPEVTITWRSDATSVSFTKDAAKKIVALVDFYAIASIVPPQEPT